MKNDRDFLAGVYSKAEELQLENNINKTTIKRSEWRMIKRRVALAYMVEYKRRKGGKESFCVSYPAELKPISERLEQAKRDGEIKSFNISRRVI